MDYDIFTYCKNALPDLLKNDQEGNSKYIFVVDVFSIAEMLLTCGYSVIFIESDQQLREITTIFNSNYWSSNSIVIGCCTKNVNDTIGNSLGSRAYIPTGWRIYNNKKEYYSLNTDDLKPIVERFVNSLNINTPTLVYDSVTGLINPKETGYREVAEYVIQKYDIVIIDDEPRKRKIGRVYEPFTPDSNNATLIGELNNSTRHYRNEVFEYIITLAPKATFTKECIPFINGVYNLKEQKLEEYNNNMYFSYCLPHNYNQDALLNKASGKIADDFFFSIACDDYAVYTLLLDIIAYCFIEGNPWQKTFFIYGTGGNGKGVFFELLSKIFGKDKVEFKTWEELGKPQGRLSIMDKMVVLCNDINDTYVKEPQALKTLTSCEPQTVKRLYQDEFTAVFRGKIISSGNAIPRVNDTSNGWQRRLILIPFEADFRSNPDVNMAKKLTTETVIEYVIALAIERLPKVLSKGFTTPARVNELIEEYRLENNPVAQFIESEGDKFKGKENGKVLDTLWVMYKNYCYDNGYNPKSKNPFAKDAKVAGVKITRHGSEQRIYYVE